jgi:hypothetical protein
MSTALINSLSNWKKMMLTVLLTGLCLGVLAEEKKEKETDSEDKLSFSLGLTTDKFFGFAPMAMGSYAFSEKIALTFYGLYWAGGSGSNWGNWSEFGLGANFNFDGIGINPQIGIVNGNLLSKGAATGQFGGIFADGIVPNLTVNVNKSKVEGQIYFGFYTPLRKIENPETGENFGQTEYIHYWANAGFKATPYFSFGAHWEHLWGGAKGDGVNTYQWIGPYIQFAAPSGKGFMRFSGGPDLVEGNNSFYKMTFGVNF